MIQKNISRSKHSGTAKVHFLSLYMKEIFLGQEAHGVIANREKGRKTNIQCQVLGPRSLFFSRKALSSQCKAVTMVIQVHSKCN